MFDLTGKNALVTGATGGIGEGIARAFHKAGATVAISGRQVDKLEALAKELGDRVHVVPCDLADKAAVAQADRRCGREARTPRHPGQQRRAHQGQPLHGDEGRSMGRRHRRQPDLDLHAHARRHPPHAALQDRLRTHHQHLVDLGHHRQSRPGQLRSLEGRHDRHDEVARPRGRQSRHHRQLHRARASSRRL